MEKCPLSTSDWFSYLQSYKHERATVALAKSAIFLTLAIFLIYYLYFSGLYFTVVNSLENNIPISIVDATGFIAIILVAILSIIQWILIVKRDEIKYRSAQEMMKKIIEGENNSNSIRKEWMDIVESIDRRVRFMPKGKGSKMRKNVNYLLWSRVVATGGSGIVILSFAAVIFVVLLSGFTYENIVPGVIPISLGLALLSIGIALDSTAKMKSIANSNFLQVVNMLEDVRVQFIAGIYDVELLTWKTLSCLQMASELLTKDKKEHFIEEKYQNKLVNFFKTTLEELFKVHSWNSIRRNQQGNIIGAYVYIEDFYRDDNTEKKLNEILTTNLNKKEMEDFMKKVEERKKN